MTDMTDSAYARYTRVAMLLHWVIAAMILFQLVMGFLMTDALEASSDALKRWGFEQVQLHKSVGITVLGLSVLRLAWRLVNPAPALPEGMGALERMGAHFSHWAFYGLMIGAPLTGWAMVSSSPEFSSLKTFYFGLFAVPHLPVAEVVGEGAKGAVSGAMHEVHELIALGGCALLIVHVLAALKHHFFDRDAVLARMVPGVSPRDGREMTRPVRGWGGGRVLAALALLGLTGAATAGLYYYEARKAVAQAAAPAAPLPVADGAPKAADAAGVATWAPAMAESEIVFSGTNSGAPFTGVFKTWAAEIAFDPEALDKSSVRVTVDVSSARTGDAQSDATLPEPDWFNAAEHPQAVFVAERFREAEGEGAYVAEGELTMRGVTKPFALPFTLKIEGDRAEMSAAVPLNRLDFGVGEAADASGGWVSLEIPLSIKVVAQRERAGG